MHIQSFPLEISCMILGHLDDDSIKNAVLVSRYWYHAVGVYTTPRRKAAFQYLQPILKEVCDAIANCYKTRNKILEAFSQDPTKHIKNINITCFRKKQIAGLEKKWLEKFLEKASLDKLQLLEVKLEDTRFFADLPITLIIKKKLKLQRPLERLFDLVQERLGTSISHSLKKLNLTTFSIIKHCPHHGFFLLKLFSYYYRTNFPLQMVKDIDKDHEAKPFGNDILEMTVCTAQSPQDGAYINYPLVTFSPDRYESIGQNRGPFLGSLLLQKRGPFLGSLLLNRKYNTQAFSIYLWLCTFSREVPGHNKFLNFSYRVYVKVCQIIHDHHSSFGFFPKNPELSSKCLEFYKHMAEKKLHALEKKQKKIEPAPSGEPLFIGCDDAEPEVITELVQKRLVAERENPIDKDEIVKKLNQEFIILAKHYRDESKFEDLLKLMKFLNYSDQKDFLHLFMSILEIFDSNPQVIVKLIQKVNNYHRLLNNKGISYSTKICFLSKHLLSTRIVDLKSQHDFLKMFKLSKYERFQIASTMLHIISSNGRNERLAQRLPLVMALMGVSLLPSEAQLPSPEAGEGKGEPMEVDDECEKKYY